MISKEGHPVRHVIRQRNGAEKSEIYIPINDILSQLEKDEFLGGTPPSGKNKAGFLLLPLSSNKSLM